tara:strand:- start:2078 stop:2437 length:360 start_codon:yes stop_codon:yes gene_type:complete
VSERVVAVFAVLVSVCLAYVYMTSPPGFIFGAVDNVVVIVGCLLGIGVEERLSEWLGRKSRPAVGAAVGGGTFNLISDAGGAWLDPTMEGMLLGITLGCLVPLLSIPLVEWMRNRWYGY